MATVLLLLAMAAIAYAMVAQKVLAEPAGVSVARPLADDCVPAPAAGLARRVTASISGYFEPVARDILARHRADATLHPESGGYRLELTLDNLRDVALPVPAEGDIQYLSKGAVGAMEDGRSAIQRLWQVDEATVRAADLAYDITFRYPDGLNAAGQLPPGLAEQRLPGYDVVGFFVDAYSGFAAVVLEHTGTLAAHRIYAAAGSRVFYNTDLRTWASGMTMGRSQLVSGAALRMVADAAAYAADPDTGGEVFVTGQSQGGLTAQGLGYLIQAYLDAHGQNEHGLVHVVSWGATGALETIADTIAEARRGDGRAYPEALERHWAHTDPTYAEAMAVWQDLAAYWARLPPESERGHVLATAAAMRAVGFFFDIDPFARAGTFIGPTLAFPSALLLPEQCEDLVSERIVPTTLGELGVALEGHFLNGYQRAVARGGLAFARPAAVRKWPWVLDFVPSTRALGKAWLEMLYKDHLGASEANWQHCFQAGRWQTARNAHCERAYWPGCGNAGGEATAGAADDGDNRLAGGWCLIAVPAPP